jgi:hypothetical protein
VKPLFMHLRLHYQLLFLSPLFAWGKLLGAVTRQFIDSILGWPPPAQSTGSPGSGDSV